MLSLSRRHISLFPESSFQFVRLRSAEQNSPLPLASTHCRRRRRRRLLLLLLLLTGVNGADGLVAVAVGFRLICVNVYRLRFVNLCRLRAGICIRAHHSTSRSPSTKHFFLSQNNAVRYWYTVYSLHVAQEMRLRLVSRRTNRTPSWRIN